MGAARGNNVRSTSTALVQELLEIHDCVSAPGDSAGPDKTPSGNGRSCLKRARPEAHASPSHATTLRNPPTSNDPKTPGRTAAAGAVDPLTIRSAVWRSRPSPRTGLGAGRTEDDLRRDRRALGAV